MAKKQMDGGLLQKINEPANIFVIFLQSLSFATDNGLEKEINLRIKNVLETTGTATISPQGLLSIGKIFKGIWTISIKKKHRKLVPTNTGPVLDFTWPRLDIHTRQDTI